jgi:hypothetical protein
MPEQTAMGGTEGQDLSQDRVYKPRLHSLPAGTKPTYVTVPTSTVPNGKTASLGKPRFQQ